MKTLVRISYAIVVGAVLLAATAAPVRADDPQCWRFGSCYQPDPANEECEALTGTMCYILDFSQLPWQLLPGTCFDGACEAN